MRIEGKYIIIKICCLLVIFISVQTSQADASQNEAPDNDSLLKKDFIGFWANVNPKYSNWWEVKSDSVINYGWSADTGKCSASKAKILSENSIEVLTGNTAVVELEVIDEHLIFKFEGGFSAHKRVKPESICLGSNYVYFDDAPYPYDFNSLEEASRAISKSHVDGNMPPDDELDEILQRDLAIFARKKFTGFSAEKLSYSILGLKQVGIGWPRVYLLVQFDETSNKNTSGIVSAIAVKKEKFYIEYFFSVYDMEQDGKVVRKALPKEVFDWISKLK